jgi:N-6 DNA Methylase
MAGFGAGIQSCGSAVVFKGIKMRANRDEAIKAGAALFAESMHRAAKSAKTEADIRSAADRELAKVEEHAGITLNSRHEFTVASGRIDSVYDRVIIEYKNPASNSDRIGKTLSSAGSAKLVDQIKSRFSDLQKELGQPINSLFGVGLDGNRFLFVRYRNSTWAVEEPVDITPNSAARFLWALFNLGESGKPFVADYLARDFGAGGEATTQLIKAFYAAIRAHGDTKAETLYSEWKSLFGMVCGYDAIRSKEKIKKLAELYGIAIKSIDPPAMLFAAHTYYAVFMKFLAAEIIAFFHRLPSPTQRVLKANTSSRFKNEIEDLERGSLFRHLNISNFLEGDLFSWYTATLSPDIEAGLRSLVRVLDQYNPGTLSEEPSKSQDLLKDLYLRIMPREVRHDLGEYYTPDWVAELLLERIGLSGNPDKRFLDPACGSGTFLVAAISRVRDHYMMNWEEMRFDEGGLLTKILTNVVGFDLNPLAVLAARTNYLIAVRDLLSHVDKIEIPVYLSDSVVTPAEYGDLFTGAAATAQVPCAAAKPPFLLVPKEVGKNSLLVAQYAEALEHSLSTKLSPDEFVEQCRERGLTLHQGESA